MKACHEWKEGAWRATQGFCDHIREGFGSVQAKRIVSRIQQQLGYALGNSTVMFVLVFVVVSAPVLVSAPVAAQDGTEIVNDVCSSELSTLATAFFLLFSMFLGGIGVYRMGNGLKKMGSPISQTKKEGREELKGAGLVIAGAVLVFVMPGILNRLGLNFSQCVSL